MNKTPFTPTVSRGRTVWPYAIPLVVLAIFVLGQLIVILPADQLGLVSKETVETYPTILYLVIGSFGIVALLAWVGIRFWENQSLATVGLDFTRRGFLQSLRGYGVALAMGSGIVAIVFVAGGYELDASEVDKPRNWIAIATLMIAFLIQSFTEEVVFRGWMMARLAARYGLLIGIVGNSVLFTLMHIELGGEGVESAATLTLFTVMTLLFSIFLSLLAVRQRSVMGAGAWHAAWNWVFISSFALPTTGIDLELSPLIVPLRNAADVPTWFSGGLSGPEASIVTAVVLAAGVGVLWWSRATVYRSGSDIEFDDYPLW